MDYLNRLQLLEYLKHHCPTTIGFEQAFARVGMIVLSQLFYMIEQHSHMYVCSYEEYVDFLDGNGFEVEKSNNWYTITYLYEEESQ